MMNNTMNLMELNKEELEMVNGGVVICHVGCGMSNPFADDETITETVEQVARPAA